MKLHTSHPLLDILPASVALLLGLSGCPAGAQTIQSADLSPLIRRLVDDVTIAEADQNDERSKAVDFNTAADVFEAQARNMDVPNQGRAAARLKALDLRIKAYTVQIETARRSAQLLVAAQDALNEIHGRVDGPDTRSAETLPVYESQRQIDREMTNLSFGGNSEVDACSAQALRSARDFYQSVCTNGFGRQEWSVALHLADQHLAAWAASNRATIVMSDTMLHTLELEKADAMISRGAASSGPVIGRTVTHATQMSASISQAQHSGMRPAAVQTDSCSAPSYSYPVPSPPANVIFTSPGPTVGFPRIAVVVNPPSIQGTVFSGPVIRPPPIYRVIPGRPVYSIRGNRFYR